jgi:signal transduction histidine kinase
VNAWLVVLGLDGTVSAVSRGAPRVWRGRALDAHDGVPAALAEAAQRVVAAAKDEGGLASGEVVVPELDATIQLVAMAAVALRLERIDLRELLGQAVAPLGAQVRARDVALAVTVDPSVPSSVPADAEKLAWAVATLVGNALRYVRCGTRNMPGGSVEVRASLDAGRREIVLEVRDDGPGIPEDVVRRVLDRASSARGALALRVVRDMVAAQGGSMEIASSTGDDEDAGTTITLRLPSG